MPYYTGAIAVARVLIVSAATIGILGGAVVSAQTATDNVEVMVCPDASQSSFVLNQPQSDSVTDQEKVIISGGVLFISQIDFFINDTYSHTVALGSDDVNFESSMSLPPGTHTLKFVATDSCSNVIHTQSIVVTYQPAVQPSLGSEVDTQVDGQPAVATEEEAVAPTKSVAQEVIDRVIIMPLISIGNALDITSLPAGSADQSWQNTIKSVSFVFGSSFVLGAAYIAAIGSLPSKLSFLPYSRGRVVGGLSGIGLVVLLLVFIL